MSKNYDIDHEAEDAKAALRAIIARINGEWDQPDLVAFGPLGNTLDDILSIAKGERSTQVSCLTKSTPRATS